MNDAAKAVLALTNRLVDLGVAPLKASELWPLLDAVGDPSTLAGRPAAELDAELAADLPPGVDGDRIAALLDVGVSLAVRLEALAERGIWVLTPFDDAFPPALRHRLGHAAPPVLYGAGEPALLTAEGLGIVGSREPTAGAADAARAIAKAAADIGLAVNSGGSPGIDRVAFEAALESGGRTVVVLADSLEQAIGRADTRRALIDGRACLCTPYRPDLAYDVARARGRNRIVYALSRLTVVVTVTIDADTTWAGATEALDHGYGPVAVWLGPGAGPDNDALERVGARPVTDPSELTAAG